METEEQTGIVQIDLNPSPIQIAPSEGLSEVLERVDRYLVIPNRERIAPTELKKLQKQRREKAVAEVAKVFPIPDDEACERAGGFVSECAAICKSILERWQSAKKKAHEAHADVCRMEAEELSAKEVVREAIDGNINAYRTLQRQERVKKEREDADRAAAESRRLQAEADAKAAEQRRLEEEAAVARRAGDIKAARAIQQEAAQVAQQVEAVSEQAEAAKEVYHEPAPVPQVAGRVEKWPWKGKVLDPMALIKAIAAGEWPLEHEIAVRGGGTEKVSLIEFNDAVIQYYAKRLEANARIPGVVFQEELSSSYRTK